MTKSPKISKKIKQQIADRINYFRTMPQLVRKVAADLESAGRNLKKDLVIKDLNNNLKSIVVGGKVMILRTS